jgi:hypothetical protein
MTVRSARVVALVSLAALGVACESTKSANPLSPSVAGPIPGVEISAPKPLEPGVNWEVSNDKQPLTLLIENPGSNGQRPVTIEVEVAADEGFSSKVFAKAGIEPGANGRTELRLPSKLTSDRTYFWRAKGQDGANHGPWSAPVRFSIFTPATLLAPVPVSPAGGATVGSLEPEFTFHNAPRSGPIGSITYLVEISRNDSFTALVATYTGGERNGPAGDTSIRAIAPLPSSSTLFWRVRAWDGSINGPWSSTQVFVTSAAPAPPPPPPGGGGGGGGGGGPAGNCASSDGEYVVNCIAQKYSTYRRAGVSSDQRRANMEFLRDRIIEAGLCGGLDLGWNLKRGGPEISVDFLAERSGGAVIGHDIAMDYDNTGIELQLYWGGGTFPFYTKYTHSYSCK